MNMACFAKFGIKVKSNARDFTFIQEYKAKYFCPILLQFRTSLFV